VKNLKEWIFTRKQNIDTIHSEGYSVTKRSIDVMIIGLRKELKKYASSIKTVRGTDYRFKE